MLHRTCLHQTSVHEIIDCLNLHEALYELSSCVAQIWDLESKSIVDELKPTFDKDFGKKAQVCCSLCCAAHEARQSALVFIGQVLQS